MRLIIGDRGEVEKGLAYGTFEEHIRKLKLNITALYPQSLRKKIVLIFVP
jgi:hypothetical protein